MAKRRPGHCINCSRTAQRARQTREYTRRVHLRRAYDTTPEQVQQLLEKQNHYCPICRRSISLPEGTGGTLSHDAVVDHDHETGIVRGMLCPKCNQGLGYFEDAHAHRRAAYYLDHPPSASLRMTMPHPPNPPLDTLLRSLDEPSIPKEGESRGALNTLLDKLANGGKAPVLDPASENENDVVGALLDDLLKPKPE